MGPRTIIGIMTRRATYLVRMVDLSSMSRRDPIERRHFIGNTTGMGYLRATFDEIQWARAQILVS
jgi:hypothetical protein